MNLNEAVIRDTAVKIGLTRQKARIRRLATAVYGNGPYIRRCPPFSGRLPPYPRPTFAHIRTKPCSGAAFAGGRPYHTRTAVVAAARTHAPLTHHEQRGYAPCPVQQANCVWVQPSPTSAMTATNVAENAVVDCTETI